MVLVVIFGVVNFFSVSGSSYSDGGSNAVFAGADTPINLGKDKVYGLVHQFEDRALVNLVGWDGLSDFGAVEMKTLLFGRDQKALRLPAEQKNRGMRWPVPVQQIHMGKSGLGRRIFRKAILPFAASSPQEPPQ